MVVKIFSARDLSHLGKQMPAPTKLCKMSLAAGVVIDTIRLVESIPVHSLTKKDAPTFRLVCAQFKKLHGPGVPASSTTKTLQAVEVDEWLIGIWVPQNGRATVSNHIAASYVTKADG